MCGASPAGGPTGGRTADTPGAAPNGVLRCRLPPAVAFAVRPCRIAHRGDRLGRAGHTGASEPVGGRHGVTVRGHRRPLAGPPVTAQEVFSTGDGGRGWPCAWPVPSSCGVASTTWPLLSRQGALPRVPRWHIGPWQASGAPGTGARGTGGPAPGGPVRRRPGAGRSRPARRPARRLATRRGGRSPQRAADDRSRTCASQTSFDCPSAHGPRPSWASARQRPDGASSEGTPEPFEALPPAGGPRRRLPD